MLSQGKELAALDFANIIGAPLQAVINAQASSAALTTKFIQDTAFETSSGADATSSPQKLKVVSFDFSQLMGSSGTGTGVGGGDKLQIKVPLLTMLPIPFIRVDNMTIDFNVNLHSVSKTSMTNTASVDTTASTSENLEFEKSSFTATVSDKNTYQNDQTIDDTYSLRVTVHAVQDQMPGGMQTVLNIFNGVIQQQAALIQKVMSDSINAQMKALEPTPATR
jgi:Protein of unknown function (DUF2589)